MAYSVKRKFPTRRSYRKKVLSARRSQRSYAKTRRYTRRRRVTSRKMTTRKVLEIAALKKRDTLIPTTNSTLDPDVPSTGSPAILSAGRPIPTGTPAYTYCIPWLPTYRTPNPDAGSNASTSLLTSGKPYYKGLSENITISTTGGAPWQWRRVCFTLRGQTLLAPFTRTLSDSTSAIYTPLKYFQNTFETTQGVFRSLFDIASYYGDSEGTDSPLPEAYANLLAILFQGLSNQFSTDVTTSDYVNVMTAKTRSELVSIKYDKTVTIASGNEEGVQRNYKRWHPMEKTLYYSNRELGDDTAYLPFSTEGKPGMGDYYVVDFFQCRYLADADAGDLVFDPRTTIYWHEK